MNGNVGTKWTWWFGAVLVVALVVYAGYSFEAWTGFPKGADVYARMTRVKFILDFFPYINWQYHWANGLPTFTTEAPFFYYLAAIIVKLTRISIENSMIILGFVTFSLLGIGVYGYVHTLTRTTSGATVSSFLVLSSFSTWSWMVQGGIYPRIFAVGLMAVVLWLLVWLFGKAKENSSERILLVLLIVLLSALMVTHILIGLFTFIAIFFHLVFSKLSQQQRLQVGVKVFGGSLALSAFLYLPLIVEFPSSSGRFLGVIAPVLPLEFSSLWHYDGLGPVILPILGLSLLATLLWRRKEGGLSSLTKPSFLMLALFSFYAFIGHTGLPGKYYYINGFIPFSAALFLCLFASIIVGILLSELSRTAEGKKRVTSLALATVAILGAVIVVPVNANRQKKDYAKFDRLFVYDSSAPRNRVRVTQEMGSFPDREFQYRFAPFDALEAVWFNYIYQTPQERDYYGQGILHPDWRYWFEQALWNPEFGAEETKMALDWFAIRWFSESVLNLGGVRPLEEVLAENPSRYFDDPRYEFIQSAFIEWALLLRFENPNPSPILSATNSVPVLLIGDEAGYNLFFRSLALVNLNSQELIPLLGKQFVDDYKLSDLTPFKIIVLHNYQYRQKERAYELLRDYVKEGGNLIWEVAGSPDTEGMLPEPAPVSQVRKKEVKREWDFEAFGETMTSGIDLSSFSPLIYNNDVWRVSSASSSDLRHWAKGVLGKEGQWVAAIGSYGQGKVVWTGFNFLYHMGAHKNQEEARLLVKILDWLKTEEEAKGVDYQAEFINPERRVIEISSPARGVLFKENHHKKWHVYLQGGGEQQIFSAGPGMMYVLLPNNTKQPARLTFEYRRSLVEGLGILTSVVTPLGLLCYLFRGRLPIPPFFFKCLKTMGGWWDEEE